MTDIEEQTAWYIVGFVDGEGSFNVSLRRKADYKLDWQVVLSFNVSQKDRSMLDLMKQFFGCGIIKQRKCDNLYSYDVTNPKNLWEKVIPFFDTHHFLSETKKKNYAIFHEIVEMMVDKQHLNKDGRLKILQLREKLNEGKGRKRKYSINDVISESSETTRQLPIGE